MTIEHVTSIERADDVSRYGRPKRNYLALCSCGWAADWTDTTKRGAQERANEHAAALPPPPRGGDLNEE